MMEWETGNRITLLFDSFVYSGTVTAYFSLYKKDEIKLI